LQANEQDIKISIKQTQTLAGQINLCTFSRLESMCELNYWKTTILVCIWLYRCELWNLENPAIDKYVKALARWATC